MSTDLDILRLCLTTPGTLTPVVVGAPGIGKTQRIRTLAAQMGLPTYYYTPGTHGEGFTGVVPVPGDDGYLHFPSPAAIHAAFPDGRGIYFIDELNTANPSQFPALLGMLLEGRIGDHKMPDGILRVGAMNPTSQAAAGWDLPPALANRMQYLQWAAPTGPEWSEWLCEFATGQHGPGWIKACALASAYHRKNPGRLLEDPDKVLAARFPPAFCTPRSWETAVRMLATCFDSGENTRAGQFDLYPTICEGILGKPESLEFCTWLRKNDLPDPEDLLRDPKSWEPEPNESDKVFATCFAVAEAACGDTNYGATNGKTGSANKPYTRAEKKARWAQAWRVLDRAMPLGKGIVAIAARKLSKVGVQVTNGASICDEVLKEHKDVRNVCVSLMEVCRAGGVFVGDGK